MRRTDVSYCVIQGAAKLAGSALIIIGGWWLLDAISDHFGRPMTYVVAACAVVISGAVWVDEIVDKAEKAARAADPAPGAGRS